MKKVILILTAIVLVASGVAAVSAYEAHVINVKAHVENALSVNTTDLNFGTVFPEEWLYEHREVALSDSACDELIESGKGGDLVAVNFTFYAEWKKCADVTGYYYDGQAWDAGTANFCNWMGDFMYVGFDTTTPDALNMALIGPAAAGPPSAQVVDMAISRLTDCQPHQLYIAIDVPVFEGFYNPLTDPEPKPSGKNDPTFIIPDGTNKYSPMPMYPGYDPDGMDFGIDLKIQVTGIERG